jgi:hypothetical protein
MNKFGFGFLFAVLVFAGFWLWSNKEESKEQMLESSSLIQQQIE